MLSPQPLNPADYAVVPTSPGQLLISPLKLPVPFNSPGFGRTPGAYVVQEGRLSLEMFDLGPHLASPNLQPALDLLAQTDEGTAVKALSALQRGKFICVYMF